MIQCNDTWEPWCHGMGAMRTTRTGENNTVGSLLDIEIFVCVGYWYYKTLIDAKTNRDPRTDEYNGTAPDLDTTEGTGTGDAALAPGAT